MASNASEPATKPRQRLEPDRQLVKRLLGSGAEDLRKCIQCATCSAVCELSDARNPGPRKEMLWAQWGLRDRLMADPDLWLCHQCGDCTSRCPRGARPGDVMAALRRECIVHYSTPSAIGRWVNRPGSLVWMLALVAAALAAAAGLWQSAGIGQAELSLPGPRMVFPFWTALPHWLLGSVFGALLGLDVLVLVVGARRFWRDLNARNQATAESPRPGLVPALRRILWHKDFASCAQSQARRSHHLLVVFGMVALWLTSLWVVTARWNPLLDGLVYPLGFFNPWKVMANLAGLAVAAGVALMLIERVKRPVTAGATRYPDLALLGFLLAIVLSGFATEALHFLRMEPLRYAIYVLHLVAVAGLFIMLPYSKLAHVVYRTVALVYAERQGRGPR